MEVSDEFIEAKVRHLRMIRDEWNRAMVDIAACGVVVTFQKDGIEWRRGGLSPLEKAM